MSINVKKYTKDQMAKMVEDAQEAQEHAELSAAMYISDITDLKVKNAALAEQTSQMNGEAITRENVIANLKADLDAANAASKLLNDQGQQYWRAWQERDLVFTYRNDAKIRSARKAGKILHERR